MSAAMPSVDWQQWPSAAREPLQPPGYRPRRRPWGRVLHPLTATCVVQAVLSMTLVWSNTAFGDEADYLMIGRLEWAHWLHGTSWPAAYADQILSGSPVIYPPLGALADSIGGLAGARILSLGFMLSATVLLYLTASRFIGHRGAVAAAALWALTEPALRLAFATYDPLSVLLTALSAWLAMHADRRRWIIPAAAGALALAGVTAYSGIVIVPVVIVLVFLMWLPRMGARQASFCTVLFSGATATFFCLLMTASHSWAGIMFTVFNRSGSDHQSILLVIDDIWGYSGLMIGLATVGVITSIATEGWQRAALLSFLGCAVIIVPAAQIHEQTGWSLDKHLAYGIWFGAIAAGYACDKLIRRLPRVSRKLGAVCCVIALAYPAANSWKAAWNVYHQWANATSFITAFTPAVARSHELIFTSGQDHVAEYYTPQGRDWTRWNTVLSLSPINIPHSTWNRYYLTQLRRGDYGVIALFYATTFSSAPEMKGNILLPQDRDNTNQKLLGLVGENAGEPGLPTLTQVLENDHDYQLVGKGDYNSFHVNGIYAIWRKVRG
jgi:hypothetical protein